MDLVITLFLGAIAGWAAGRVIDPDPRGGTLETILVGVAGSGLGVGLAGAAGLSLAGIAARWLSSLAGAVLLLGIVRALGSIRARPVV